jgi:hypothetical protein
MNKYILSLTLLAIFVILTGCKKKGIDPNGPQGLMTKEWRIASISVIDEEGNKVDGYVNDCLRDDVWNYENTGKFIKRIGTNHCVDDETEQVGTWELRENSKKLYMYVEGIGYYRDSIAELTTSTLKICRKVENTFFIETYVPKN